MWINSCFDGGNIEVVELTSDRAAKLALRADTAAPFLQWFYFRVGGIRGLPVTLTIANAGEASYAKGWEDYRAVASHDRQDWFRVDTRYENGALVIEHTAQADVVEFAYFAPYSLDRQADFLAALQARDGVRRTSLGLTCDGREIDYLEIGEGPRPCWIIGRQHPGETQASWWMEGFLGRLCNSDDGLAAELRREATFHIVPNMNPDGSFRGHLRTNAAGANLNREWQEPSMETSPEVFVVRDRMIETGVDFMLDVHGDEALPYNFVVGPYGVSGLADHVLSLNERFCAALKAANPDFQTEYGYPKPAADGANLTIASKYVAHRFDCLSMTLEQPFKDSAITPDPRQGWSPARCAALGRSCLDALSSVIKDLRPA